MWNPSHVLLLTSSACIKDREASERLEKRREHILNDLFGVGRSLDTLEDQMDPPPIWVPGDFVRRYFSCDDPFNGELEYDVTDDVIKVNESLCLHGQKGVHPRDARRGKLLSSVAYETIFQSLGQERAALLAGGGVVSALENLDGFAVTPSENMYCQECVDDYHLSLRPKVELLQDYLFLFEELDTKSEDASLQYDPGTIFSCDQEKYVYVVHRKFCSTLREHIKKIMKKVAVADADSIPVDEKLLPKHESLAEGIDVLDLKDIDIMGNASENDNSSIDTSVNQAITCMYFHESIRDVCQLAISSLLCRLQVHMGCAPGFRNNLFGVFLGQSGA